LARPLVLSRRRGVLDRLIQLALTLEPDARPSVEDGHQVGVGVLQLVEKEIGEEAMVAVPFPTVVERND
jgi:hypothetical protein